MDTKSLLDYHSAEQRAEFRRVDFERAVIIKTSKGCLQYDPAKRGQVTIKDSTFTIDHCLFNYTVNESKITEGAVFLYTRQTLSQAICLNRTVCTITTNALLAREGNGTAFYFDLRHAEELTEKAINQMKKCAAEAHGEDGQIILCREITPVLRMMANGLDVPILLSVPILRNEKETAKQFYKALKNNAHQVEASSPLAATTPALLKSLHAENLLISKLDSTGPGLWKVECTVYVTCLAALLTGQHMTLQTEQALHVSLSSGGVDALTIVEVVRALKGNQLNDMGNQNDDSHTDDAGANADNNAADDDVLDNYNGCDYHLTDQHTEHPTSAPNSPSSCHSDLSVLASTIPDLTAVQALTHLTAPWEEAHHVQEKVLSHTELLAYSQHALDSLQQLRKSLNGVPATTSAYAAAPVTVSEDTRSAALPVSIGASNNQGHTISAPVPLRKPLANGASAPSYQQPFTQPSPTQIHPLSNPLPTAPPLSTSNSANKVIQPALTLPSWMQELQQSRRNTTPVFTPTSAAQAPYLPPQPSQKPLKRKDWSLSSDSDSVIQNRVTKRARGSDGDRCDVTTPAPLATSPQNQRSTIRDTKWVKLTMEVADARNGQETGHAQVTPTVTLTAPSALSSSAASSDATHIGTTKVSTSNGFTPQSNSKEPETFLLPKRRTAILRKSAEPQQHEEQQEPQQQQQKQQHMTSDARLTASLSVTSTTLQSNNTNSHYTNTPDKEDVITNMVTEISDTEDSTAASVSSNATDTLLQPQPQPYLLPTSVRHATTGITMYATSSTDYERLSDFLEYALEEKVQEQLHSLAVPVAVYRGAAPPVLSPEVVCIELNQTTLPATTFEELVQAQLALRKEFTIKVENED